MSALKPVISGFDARDAENDTARILRSCGLPAEPKMMDIISPWQFKTPLTPSMAARAEEKPMVDMDKLVAFCRDYHVLKSDFLLVEGVGGVMAPMTKKHTVLDWMVALNWPIILVVGSYLGAISHTLTALETLRTNGLKVAALVVSESFPADVSLADTTMALENFVPRDVPIVKIPRLRDGAEPWKDVPSISWIVESANK